MWWNEETDILDIIGGAKERLLDAASFAAAIDPNDEVLVEAVAWRYRAATDRFVPMVSDLRLQGMFRPSRHLATNVTVGSEDVAIGSHQHRRRTSEGVAVMWRFTAATST
jgi:hypothetical protein